MSSPTTITWTATATVDFEVNPANNTVTATRSNAGLSSHGGLYGPGA